MPRVDIFSSSFGTWGVFRIALSIRRPDCRSLLPAIALNDGGKALTADFQQTPFETQGRLGWRRFLGSWLSTGKARRTRRRPDLMEIHSANGYLVDQFLEDKTNKRTDEYGGVIENRARLLMEVVDAIIHVWGKGRGAFGFALWDVFRHGRLRPYCLIRYVLEQLSKRSIAYVHIVEPRVGNAGADAPIDSDAPKTAEIFAGRSRAC